jgi:hypothetical protein
MITVGSGIGVEVTYPSGQRDDGYLCTDCAETEVIEE